MGIFPPKSLMTFMTYTFFNYRRQIIHTAYILSEEIF